MRPIVARVQLSARPIVARVQLVAPIQVAATSFRASSFRRPIDVTPITRPGRPSYSCIYANKSFIIKLPKNVILVIVV
jgi:hypothetical protein